MKNILDNKLAMFGILVVVVVAFFWLSTIDFGEETGIEIEIEKNKDYKLLESKILQYQETKIWNPQDYKRINANLSDYEKDKLISTRQKEQLEKLLSSAHMLLLNDSIYGFCRYTTKLYEIKKLADDLKVMKNKTSAELTAPAQKLVDEYNHLGSLCAGIQNYTKKEPFNQGRFKYYESGLSDYQIKDVFSSNTHFQDKTIKYYLKILQNHKLDNLNFESEGVYSGTDCNASFRSKYYRQACEKEKIRLDSIANANN